MLCSSFAPFEEQRKRRNRSIDISSSMSAVPLHQNWQYLCKTPLPQTLSVSSLDQELYRNQLISISGVCYCEDCSLLYSAAGILHRLSRNDLSDSFHYDIPEDCLRYPSESFADWVKRICVLQD